MAEQILGGRDLSSGGELDSVQLDTRQQASHNERPKARKYWRRSMKHRSTILFSQRVIQCSRVAWTR
jgi:hypothetical protein